MKPLLKVTRERRPPHSMYLKYSDVPVARTSSLDGDEHYVNVDLDTQGEVVGIEIVFPDDRSVELAVSYALERGLSLTGLVTPSAGKGGSP
jgi:uncharacterized protein YuzE